MNLSTSANQLKIAPPYQVCLLITVVLAVYYPSMFAEFSLLDDKDVISSLLNTWDIDLWSLFFPRVKEGGYYRPFIGVSYYIDRFWWFLESKIMHFENILMHLANTLMLFWTARALFRQHAADTTMFPLATALLFALHPINTESINWISGRTDAMACTFVLGALLLVLRFREGGKWYLVAAAFVATLLGAMAKETALGFLPAAVVILMAAGDTGIRFSSLPFRRLLFPSYTAVAFLVALFFSNYYAVICIGGLYWIHSRSLDYAIDRSGGLSLGLRNGLIVAASCVMFLAVFYGMRKIAYRSDISKISTTMQVMLADINYTLELFTGTAGYYVRKFFVPVPLNIAIREVDPLYGLFGVLCFMMCVHLLLIRRLPSALVIAGFFLLAPAFPLAFGTIAWTAYAERYLYIPSAFWILSITMFLHTVLEKRNNVRRILLAGFSFVVVVFAVMTFQRNLLWQTNVGLFRDAVEKSPDFKNVRGIYMSALMEKGDFAEAERQYFIAKKLHSVRYEETYDLGYVSILVNTKRYEEAERMLDEIEKNTKGKSARLYSVKAHYYGSRIRQAAGADLVRLRERKIDAMQRLYGLDGSPDTAYRLAQEYIAAGQPNNAIQMLKEISRKLPSGDPQRVKADALVYKLYGKSL